MLYLKAATERCSLKCAFFKTQETRRPNKHNDREDQRHDLSDVKLLLIHVLKILYRLSRWLYISLLLRCTEIILMLLAYQRWKEFCQNLSKVQIFHHYIIDAFRLLPASSHSKLGFQTFEVDFSKTCDKCHFWGIPLVNTK